jgi:hypothetical protein
LQLSELAADLGVPAQELRQFRFLRDLLRPTVGELVGHEVERVETLTELAERDDLAEREAFILVVVQTRSQARPSGLGFLPGQR